MSYVHAAYTDIPNTFCYRILVTCFEFGTKEDCLYRTLHSNDDACLNPPGRQVFEDIKWKTRGQTLKNTLKIKQLHCWCKFLIVYEF